MRVPVLLTPTDSFPSISYWLVPFVLAIVLMVLSCESATPAFQRKSLLFASQHPRSALRRHMSTSLEQLPGRHILALRWYRGGGCALAGSCPAIQDAARVQKETDQHGQRWHLNHRYLCFEAKESRRNAAWRSEGEECAQKVRWEGL